VVASSGASVRREGGRGLAQRATSEGEEGVQSAGRARGRWGRAVSDGRRQCCATVHGGRGGRVGAFGSLFWAGPK
jgi:hypothetical protein